MPWRLAFMVAMFAGLSTELCFADDAACINPDPARLEIMEGANFFSPLTLSQHSDAAGNLTLIFDGEIASDSDKAFSQFLSAVKPPVGSEIWMRSPGGDPIAAMEIGRQIRSHGLKTLVGRYLGAGQYDFPMAGPAICASACTIAFAGGVQRIIPSGSLFGVHNANQGSAQPPYSFEKGQAYAGQVAHYFLEMGVNPDLINFWGRFNSQAGETCFMTEPDLARFAIVRSPSETRWKLTTNSQDGEPQLTGAVDGPNGPTDTPYSVTLTCEAGIGREIRFGFVDQLGTPSALKQFAGTAYIKTVTVADTADTSKKVVLTGADFSIINDYGRQVFAAASRYHNKSQDDLTDLLDHSNAVDVQLVALDNFENSAFEIDMRGASRYRDFVSDTACRKQ